MKIHILGLLFCLIAGEAGAQKAGSSVSPTATIDQSPRHDEIKPMITQDSVLSGGLTPTLTPLSIVAPTFCEVFPDDKSCKPEPPASLPADSVTYSFAATIFYISDGTSLGTSMVDYCGFDFDANFREKSRDCEAYAKEEGKSADIISSELRELLSKGSVAGEYLNGSITWTDGFGYQMTNIGSIAKSLPLHYSPGLTKAKLCSGSVRNEWRDNLFCSNSGARLYNPDDEKNARIEYTIIKTDKK